MQIYTHPYHTLSQVSTPWTKGDKIEGYNDLLQFEKDMVDLMKKSNGIGLAANQIGITKRFFAIGSDTFDTFKKNAIIWNPLIKKHSKEKVFDVEGCLSFPDIWIQVERPKQIEVQYETTQSETKTATLDGMESKCFQHELDHLDGITFNSRVSKLKWDMAKKKAGKK
jgi:peptide deformylase